MVDLKVTYFDAEGDEATLPALYEVCESCQGKGTHVNRAIDGNGLDPELEEDLDFMEGYLSGVYDVSCEECRGKRVVAVVDERRCNPDDLTEYYAHKCQENEARLCQLAEIRFAG